MSAYRLSIQPENWQTATKSLLLAVCLGAMTAWPTDVQAQQTAVPVSPWPSVIGESAAGNTSTSKSRKRVVSGSLDTAPVYYQSLANTIGFPYNSTDPDDSANTLNALINYYLGYVNFNTRSIETVKPIAAFPNRPQNATNEESALYSLQKDELFLVSRFFAPKIVNFAVSRRPYDAGWRKLVYIKSMVNSPAWKNAISGAYVLFNYFQRDPSADPFNGAIPPLSSNNQVILVPNFEANGAPAKKHIEGEVDTAYFAVYNGFNGGCRLINSLTAGFDIPLDGDLKQYAVPDACAQCHGQNGGAAKIVAGTKVFSHVKPNYLDTDQWYDSERLDFPAVLAGPFDPIYDGGRDHNSAQYNRAMKVIEKINAQIAVDGKRVTTDARSGVKTWQQLRQVHGSGPVPTISRGLPPVKAGDPNWGEGRYDAPLLDMLSQNCFRCHGSIKYNVFDKRAVVEKATTIQAYISDENGPYMPEGRKIPTRDRDCLSSMMNLLTKENATNVIAEDVNEAIANVKQTCGYKFCPADFDGDGTVDIADHATLLATWGECNAPCAADLDGNGSVDIADVSALFVSWGSCPTP